MPWPDQAKVVMSEIFGTVWQDENDDTTIDDGEPRHQGVHVTLEQQTANTGSEDEGWEQIATTTTGEDGTYRFDGLHSGTYRVVLPNVERSTDKTSRQVTGVNGEPDGVDGETLAGGATNRFDVFTATEQTRSYQLTNVASSSMVVVQLGIDATVEQVDFGYLVPSVDVVLDKSPASVTSNSDDNGFENVTWDVTIKNTGNRPIEGLTLTDRTSKEVQGLRAEIGYAKETSQITGTPVAVTGDLPKDGTNTGGTGVLTSDGYWLRKQYSRKSRETDNVSTTSGEAHDNCNRHAFGHN